jgi:hypothetical protein
MSVRACVQEHACAYTHACAHACACARAEAKDPWRKDGALQAVLSVGSVVVHCCLFWRRRLHTSHDLYDQSALSEQVRWPPARYTYTTTPRLLVLRETCRWLPWDNSTADNRNTPQHNRIGSGEEVGSWCETPNPRKRHVWLGLLAIFFLRLPLCLPCSRCCIASSAHVCWHGAQDFEEEPLIHTL